MKAFKDYHPLVGFFYFLAVIGFSMVFMHPICTFFSIVVGILTFGFLKGLKEIPKIMGLLLALVVFGGIFNGIFNHRGVTMIFYLPSGNPFTLEAVIYGAVASGVIGAVMSWLFCLNLVMTSEKIMYLFGKALPNLALVFSMTLGFGEKFKRQISDSIMAQKCLKVTETKNSKSLQLKNAITAFSVSLSIMLEDSIETVNSMRARGFGIGKRTAFSLFVFQKRDLIMLAVIFILSILVGISCIKQVFFFEAFPSIRFQPITAENLWAYVAYLALLSIPIFTEIWGEIKWKFLK